jgi:hypothetical protein
MDVSALRAASPPNVRWVTRFVSDAELAALFRAADLAVLPYREIDQSACCTPRWRSARRCC